MVIQGIDLTKTKIKSICQEILNRSIPDKKLNNEDELFIIDLIKYHPRSIEKIGCGIKNIIVKKGLYNCKCFYILRVDNTEIDFSYNHCLSGSKSNKSKFSEAARRVVQNYIYNLVIQYSYKNNYDFKNYELHHTKPSFEEIISNFIDEYKIDLSIIEYDRNKQGLYFIDKKLCELFYCYHNYIMKYEIITKENHLKITKEFQKERVN
jgi:hypothetical protein